MARQRQHVEYSVYSQLSRSIRSGQTLSQSRLILSSIALPKVDEAGQSLFWMIALDILLGAMLGMAGYWLGLKAAGATIFEGLIFIAVNALVFSVLSKLTQYYRLDRSHHSLGQTALIMTGLIATAAVMIASFWPTEPPSLFYNALAINFSTIALFSAVSALSHYVLGKGFQKSDNHCWMYQWEQCLKRFFDFTLSLGGLLFISPVLLIIAIAIMVESPANPLYSQTRIGLDEKRFLMWKFRSMLPNASRLEQQNLPVLFKSQNDPRITKMGWIIRKLSIDELPQLWNILTGSMSLVGPRPPIEEEFALMNGYHRQKFQAVPGVTGLWQITGRIKNEREFNDVARYDLQYIESWSLMQDLMILIKTVPVVLFQRGAY